jgi:hypothetical protein
MANINEFKSRLKGGGARANQFKVTLPFPGYSAVGGETSDLSFLCTATSIPGQTLGMTEVQFRGRTLKMAGDSRTFGDWSLSVLNDTDFKIFKAFERWMNGMNNMTDNEGLTNPLDYQVDGFIDHLDRDGNSIKQYTFRGVFPTTLGDIALDYGTSNAIESFDVTLSYQYFETDTTT